MRSVYPVLRVTDTHVTVERESGSCSQAIFGWGDQPLKQWCNIFLKKSPK